MACKDKKPVIGDDESYSAIFISCQQNELRFYDVTARGNCGYVAENRIIVEISRNHMQNDSHCGQTKVRLINNYPSLIVWFFFFLV